MSHADVVNVLQSAGDRFLIHFRVFVFAAEKMDGKFFLF